MLLLKIIGVKSPENIIKAVNTAIERVKGARK